jgi:hypothetical protein
LFGKTQLPSFQKESKMSPIMRTIVKDIIVLSAQAVAFRLAAPQDQQQDVIFAAVPTKGPAGIKALPGESETMARKVGF